MTLAIDWPKILFHITIIIPIELNRDVLNTLRALLLLCFLGSMRHNVLHIGRIERTLIGLGRSIERIEKKLSLTENIVYVGSVKFYIPNFPSDYIQRVIAEGHFFEERILKELDRYLDRGSVVLDVGANIGNHTLWWSKVTDAVGVKRVYAFEPIDLTFSALRRNIEINGLSGDRVIINEIGLGKDEGTAVIDGKYDYHDVGRTSIRAETKGGAPFKIIPLDGYVKSVKFKDKKIDFIKIDVEGFEEDVLLGAKETLKKYSPIIFIEIFPDKFDRVNRLLDSLGYRLEKKFDDINHLYTKETQPKK
ncbi:MAG: FkbM family methyltransferase [Rickettsiales bacterium]|nr:FkbM family methyltransferase [Rickettsiales bacterium]